MTCPEGRSCTYCGPAARTRRKAAQAPTVADGAIDRDDFDADPLWDTDDYEADDDGKLHAVPLRVPLVEIARIA